MNECKNMLTLTYKGVASTHIDSLTSFFVGQEDKPFHLLPVIVNH